MSTNRTRSDRSGLDVKEREGRTEVADPSFDELEQYLRAQAQARAQGAPAQDPGNAFTDPLMAELARIVSQDPRPAGNTPLPASQPGRPLADESDPLKAFEEELRRFDAGHRAHQAAAAAPEVPPQASPLTAEHYAHYAPVPEPMTADRPVPPQMEPVPAAYEPVQVQPAGEGPLEPQGVIAPDLAPVVPLEKPRSKKVMMMLGSAAALLVVGVVGSAIYPKKSKVAGEAPVIAAKTAPVKEKPADPGGVEVPGQDRQVLAKKTEEQKSPAAVVSKDEQPVDLNQTPKREVPRVAAPTDGQAAPAAPVLMPQGATPAASPAAAPPAAAPPAQSAAAPSAPAAAPAANQPPATAGGFEAKRVRSIKIGSEAETAQNVPAPAAVAAAQQAAKSGVPTMAAVPQPAPAAATARPAAPKAEPPKAETPKVEAPKAEAPKAEAPKSDARPVTATRPVQQAATTPQPVRPRPGAAQAPQTEEAAGDGAPLSLRPPSGGSTAAIRRTTTSAGSGESAAPAAGGGGFSVQLAAPGSEAEARAVASRLKERHADVLGGHTPGVRRAEVGERTVYRVRVGGLSREAANGLCSRLKADGGSCFVAAN